MINSGEAVASVAVASMKQSFSGFTFIQIEFGESMKIKEYMWTYDRQMADAFLDVDSHMQKIASKFNI